MAEKFNTYINHIEPEFWRELCIKEGTLRHFEKGEAFVFVGNVARYIGYIQSGTMKYVAYSENGAEHVVGMNCIPIVLYITIGMQFISRYDSSSIGLPKLILHERLLGK